MEVERMTLSINFYPLSLSGIDIGEIRCIFIGNFNNIYEKSKFKPSETNRIMKARKNLLELNLIEIFISIMLYTNLPTDE